MKRPIVIGITGGIGGGKSVFSRHLRDRGELVYDTDIQAKLLQNTDKKLREKITEAFGDVYSEAGLDSRKLAQIVFSDPEKLKLLNGLVHPAVIDDFNRWIAANSNQNFLFIESAILYEANLENLIDKVVVITAPEEVRIKRVMRRDKISREKVVARIKNQLPESEKIKRADWVIDTHNELCRAKRVEKFLKLLASELTSG